VTQAGIPNTVGSSELVPLVYGLEVRQGEETSRPRRLGELLQARQVQCFGTFPLGACDARKGSHLWHLGNLGPDGGKR
jgi:hypothetical protein